MCGIAGKVSSESRIAPGLVERMCGAMTHRGPDARGLHREDGAELGIQRLRVIDLETGDQPIYNETGEVAVVLNGEIYNYRELRSDLSRRGHVLATKGDTEVIVHLYEELGPDCVRELHGMFSFALWDARRRRLMIARDRVGKKPLFYWAGRESLTFASELAALMEDAEIPRDVDPDALDCYLAYACIPAPLTVWRGVRKLPPAHTLVWERGQLALNRYWRLDYSQQTSAPEPELVEELRRRIGASVRRRMIADVPLGAFLSGGVDSSIVVSEMAAASPAPVKTFSIGFEAPEYNELPQARLTAERFATDHHELVVRPDALALVPKIVRHYGEPFADSSAIPSFYLAELARREVTVALNGDGGDESFAGYVRYAVNQLTAGVDRVPRPLRRAVVALGERLPARPGAKSFVGRAQRLLTSLGEDPVERYRRHTSLFNSREREALLASDFRASIDPTAAPEVIAEPWREASGDSRLDTLMEVDVATYLPNDLLTKMDIATMAHSLEARSPLLDPEVMEFAATLPANLKLRRLQRKRILRRAYRGRVPDRILDGAKRGFGVPIDHWFRGELQAYARELLLDPATLDRGYFDGAEVKSLLDRHASGAGDRSAQIWGLVMLEEWHRQFADRPTADSGAHSAAAAARPS
jgi:asparagine synthase (glutamine-hydrolysing)